MTDPKTIDVTSIHKETMSKSYVQAVACATCGKLHKATDETFIAVHGNVCVGWNGGIIGNNFDQNGKVYRVSTFCKTKECMKPLLDHLT